MLFTHIIVDVKSNRGHVGLFWKRVSPVFLMELAPVQITLTKHNITVSQLIRKAIQAGNKKIIIIGDRNAIGESINALMLYSPDLRKQLELGFWSLNYWDMLVHSAQSLRKLKNLIQVFKIGHTCLVDLGKVQTTHSESLPQNLYFWQRCDFSYIQTNSKIEKPLFQIPFLKKIVPLFTLPKARLEVEPQILNEAGGEHTCIRLHACPLDSFKMQPEEVVNTLSFILYWRKGRKYQGKWLRWGGLSWGGLPLLWPLLKQHKGSFHEKKVQKIALQTFEFPLSLHIDDKIVPCDTAQFEIEHKALPIIVKMVPVQDKNHAKQRSRLPFKNAIKASRIIANRDY